MEPALRAMCISLRPMALAAARIPKCNIFLFSDHDAGREFWLLNGWAHRRDLHVMQKPIAVASGQR